MMPPGRDATLDAVRRPAEAGAPSTGNGESGFPYYPAYPAATVVIGETHARRKHECQLIGAEKVRRPLDEFVRDGQDATPLMHDIGEHVLNATRDRFDSQTDPASNPWEPLSDNTRQRKKRNRDKILTLDSDLRGNPCRRVDGRCRLGRVEPTHGRRSACRAMIACLGRRTRRDRLLERFPAAVAIVLATRSAIRCRPPGRGDETRLLAVQSSARS